MDDALLKPLDRLPLKHRLYVLGIITHKGDKTKAARSAGYSPKTCMEQGQQLYRKLQAYIEPLTRGVVKAYALNAEQVVQGLSLIASSDVRDYLTWGADNTVTLKASSELTPEQAYCIDSVEQHETQFSKTIKLRLAKKQPALDSLAQYHNLYRRVPGSKGLVVVFEEGASAGQKAEKARGARPAPRTVEVTFEEIPNAQ